MTHIEPSQQAQAQPEPVVVWGRQAWAGPPGQAVLRVEDGFLRSVGLGADLVQPLSWVVDTRGLYYDARSPSDLEHLLQSSDFSHELLARARRLRERLLSSGLTKYNLGGLAWRRPPQARRVVLVVGQVESDASIALGAPGLRTNMALLQGVRRELESAGPGSGHRRGSSSESPPPTGRRRPARLRPPPQHRGHCSGRRSRRRRQLCRRRPRSSAAVPAARRVSAAAGPELATCAAAAAAAAAAPPRRRGAGSRAANS
jgi:hypothetical protein